MYLARRRATRQPLAGARALAVALAVGVAAGGLARAQGFPDPALAVTFLGHPLGWALVLPVVIAEELLFRGVVQRGLEEALQARPSSMFVPTPARARLLAALGSVLISVVAASAADAPRLGVLLALHGAAALTRAVTGRNSASILTRVAATAVAVAASALHG